VWDATTGQVLLTLKGHTDTINGIAFSPDGSGGVHPTGGGELSPTRHPPRLVTASADGTVKVWDSVSGQLFMNLSVRSQPWDVAYSSDGTHLAAAVVDGTAKVWDAATESWC